MEEIYTPAHDVSEVQGIDPRNRHKKQTYIARILFATLFLLLAVTAVFFAFWCPATHSFKFFSRCGTETDVTGRALYQATSTTEKGGVIGGDTDATDPDGLNGDNALRNGGSAGTAGGAGFEANASDGDGGDNSTRSGGGSGRDGASGTNGDDAGDRDAVYNYYYTYETNHGSDGTDGSNGRDGTDGALGAAGRDGQNGNLGIAGRDGANDTTLEPTWAECVEELDFVCLDLFRKQVNRVYDYIEDRFDEIAEEFTTKVLNVTDAVFLGGTVMDSTSSAGNIGDILITTGTGVRWVSTSTLASSLEIDPIFTASAAYDITNTDISNWDEAYILSNILAAASSTWNNTATIVAASSTYWDEAYSWGDHSLAGYATGTNMWGGALGGDAYNLNLGNVGIGTTTPSSLLTVAGDINVTGMLRTNGSAGVPGYILQSTGAGMQWVATSSLAVAGANPAGSDMQVQFNQGGTFGASSGLVYDYTTNNLGVGMAAPLATLSVGGNVDEIVAEEGNRILNGSFDTDADQWYLGACATWDSGAIVVVDESCLGSSIVSTSPQELVVGVGYKLTFTLSDVTNEDVDVLIDGESFGHFATGTHAVNFTSESSNPYIVFRPHYLNSNATFTLDDVVLQLVTTPNDWRLGDCAIEDSGTLVVTYDDGSCSEDFVASGDMQTLSGALYELTFTLSNVVGNVDVYEESSQQFVDSFDTAGTHTVFVTSAGLTRLRFEGSSEDGDTFTLVKNIAVRPVGRVRDVLLAENAFQEELMRLTGLGRLSIGAGESPVATLSVQGRGTFVSTPSQVVSNNLSLGDCAELTGYPAIEVYYDSNICFDTQIALAFPVGIGAYEITFTLFDVANDTVDVQLASGLPYDADQESPFGNGTYTITFWSDYAHTETLLFNLSNLNEYGEYKINPEIEITQVSKYIADPTVLVRNSDDERMLWLGDGLSSIVAVGQNAGVGSDINHSNFIGAYAGYGVSSGVDINAFGNNAGRGALNVDGAVFVGGGAGYNAQNNNHSVFIGLDAGNYSSSHWDIDEWLCGNECGSVEPPAISTILIGASAGAQTGGSGNIFIGDSAGALSTLGDSIIIGHRAGINDSAFGGCGECGEYGNSILIGNDTSTGGFWGSIAMGQGAVSTADQQFLVAGINSVVFSEGTTPFFSMDSGSEGSSLSVGTTPIATGLTLQGNSIIHTSGAEIEKVSDDADFDVDTVLDQAMDVAVTNYASSKYAYVANGANGLAVIDVSNPASITLVEELLTADVAKGIVIADTYAYVADGESGLQVFNIETGYLDLKGSYNTSGNASAVFVSGKYAYVADDLGGLTIVDISDPDTPIFVGTYDTPGSARDVFVSGKYAYVADGTSGLQIIDISDPGNPILAGTFDTDGTARGVAISGKYAYVADREEELAIIDITNPASLVLVNAGYTYIGGGHPTAVAISGKYLYTAGENSGFVVDITDPTQPDYGSPLIENTSVGIVIDDGFVYAVGNFEFDIFSISGVNTPGVYTDAVETDTLSVSQDLFVGGHVWTEGAVHAGFSGFVSEGGISVSATSTFLGSLGLGTTTPSAQLTTTGTVRFANFGAGSLQTDALGNVTVSSDERLKNKEGDFTRGIADIIKINPITYTWKEETGYDTATVYTGFSAQNVQDAIPEATATDTRGYLTLSDRPILAAVVNALKEIWEKVTGQEERIIELENRIRELEAREGINHQAPEMEQEEEVDAVIEEEQGDGGQVLDDSGEDDASTVEEPTLDDEPVENPADTPEEAVTETGSEPATGDVETLQ